MPGGRPPKPTEQKRRLGNPGKRALPERRTQEAASPVSAPPMPRGLKRHGKSAWLRYWTVGSPWLNATTDVEIVTRLCEAYDEREELRGLVRRYGHLVAELFREDELDGPEGDEPAPAPVAEAPAGVVPFPGVTKELEGQPHGGALRRRRRRGARRIERVYQIKANPAVQQLRKLEELITRYEGLCGFTPSDRSRLGLAEVKAASALDQLIARQQERRAARRAPEAPSDDGTIIDVEPL